MAANTIYKPIYDASWALVVGINDYRIAPPLGYARQDAEAFASSLRSRFGFPEEKTATLLDADATRESILSAFLRFTGDPIGPDDRIAVFFAGHGCTRTGNRGEVGFLVPVDGDPNNLASLIRWDDLTRNAELIQAKHVFFVMDACYGGLALQRNTPPGSARFLKDMLQRYCRQVLTAGKADEAVADSGGPRPGHSIFTGHLLDALEGKAADSNGIISANAVMSYVYDHVGKDVHSRQSPHFGFIDGDGDFIFSSATPEVLGKDANEENDILVQVPANTTVADDLADRQALVDRVKEFLSELRFQIRLDDVVSDEIRTASYNIREEEFPIQTATVTPEDVLRRLRKYESAISRLRAVTILVCRWGRPEHKPLIEKVVARLADGTELRSGKAAWLGLRWYPMMMMLYSGGIAALSSNNYSALHAVLTTRLRGSKTGGQSQATVVTVEEILEVERLELFKRLPGYESFRAPRSEYLFKTLQPDVEDLLYVGNGYEDLFDRFEVFYALNYLDLNPRPGYVWAPPGRFVWKRHLGHNSPFQVLFDEAKQAGQAWPPLSAGFFGGSATRFYELANTFESQFLSKIQEYWG